MWKRILPLVAFLVGALAVIHPAPASAQDSCPLSGIGRPGYLASACCNNAAQSPVPPFGYQYHYIRLYWAGPFIVYMWRCVILF